MSSYFGPSPPDFIPSLPSLLNPNDQQVIIPFEQSLRQDAPQHEYEPYYNEPIIPYLPPTGNPNRCTATERKNWINAFFTDYMRNPPGLYYALRAYELEDFDYVPGKWIKLEEPYPAHWEKEGPVPIPSSLKLLLPPGGIFSSSSSSGDEEDDVFVGYESEDEGRGSGDSFPEFSSESSPTTSSVPLEEFLPSNNRYVHSNWPVSWDEILAPFPHSRYPLEYFSENRLSNLNTRQILTTTQFASEDSAGPLGPIVSTNLWKLLPSSAPIKANSKYLSEPSLLSIHKFIHDCLQLCCARESNCFSFNRSNEQYQWSYKFVICGLSNPTTVKNYVRPFRIIGTVYRKLVLKVQARNEAHKNPQNYVYNYIIRAIQSFLDNYEAFISSLFRGNEAEIRTLTGLSQLPKKIIPQLEICHSIINLADTSTTLELLGNLFVMWEKSIGRIESEKGLIQRIYVQAVNGYSRHISDWIFRGTVSSPEFHISYNEEEAQDHRYTLTKTRSHWLRLFDENAEEVPKFLPDSLVHLMLETGKNVALFNSVTSGAKCKIHSKYNFGHSPRKSLNLQLSFPKILQLTNIYEDHWAQFQLEHSAIFQSEIKKELKLLHSITLHQFPDIDFASLSQTRLDYLLSHPETREELLRRRKEMYRILRISRPVNSEPDMRNKQLRRKRSNSVDMSVGERNLNPEPPEEIPQPLNLTLQNRRLSKSMEDLVLIKNPALRSHQDSSQISSTMEYSSYPVPKKSNKPQSLGQDEIPFAIGRKRSSCTNTKKKIPSSVPEILSTYERADGTIRDLNIDGFKNEEGDELVMASRGLNPDNLILRDVEPYTKPTYEIFTSQPFIQISGIPVENKVKSTRAEKSSSLMNHFVTESIEIPLLIQYKMINSALLHYLIVEEKLFVHLGAINDYLLLHNGLFGHSLATVLIDEVKNNNLRNLADLSRRSTRLGEILKETFYSSIPNSDDESTTKLFIDGFSISFIGPDQDTGNSLSIREYHTPEYFEQNVPSIYNILNSLGLKYTVEWPVNLLLTREILSHAEAIFNLLFKLQRAQLLLEQIFSEYKSKCIGRDLKIENIFRYRHHILHFVSTLRYHLITTIIDPAWKRLCFSLSQNKLENLEELYQLIIHYITTVSRNCLIDSNDSTNSSARAHQPSSLLKIVLRALVVIESFCSKVQLILSRRSSRNLLNPDVERKSPHDRDYKEITIKFQVIEMYQEQFVKALFEISSKCVQLGNGGLEHIPYLIQSLDYNRFIETKIWGEKGWAPGKKTVAEQELEKEQEEKNKV